MFRTIEYTVSPDGVSPASTQFAGIQGENNATVLRFTPDIALESNLELLAKEFDYISYRVDCIDGAGRTITGAATDYSSGAVDFPLESLVTEAGGNLRVCLSFSGTNNNTAPATVLYSFPVSLYFENFPFCERFTERSQLNKALLQAKLLREETYDIAAAAREINQEILLTREQVREDSELASNAADSALTSANNSAENAASAITAREEAQDYANTVLQTIDSANQLLTQAQQSSQDAISAAQNAALSAENAALAEQAAAHSLSELRTIVGDVDTVFSRLVTLD